VTRAEIDVKIATLRLTITLADGVCAKAYEDAEDEFEAAKDEAANRRAHTEREADRRFYKVKDEAEAEIARLEGLEVTE